MVATEPTTESPKPTFRQIAADSDIYRLLQQVREEGKYGTNKNTLKVALEEQLERIRSPKARR